MSTPSGATFNVCGNLPMDSLRLDKEQFGIGIGEILF